jgi:hypothetical protein
MAIPLQSFLSGRFLVTKLSWLTLHSWNLNSTTELTKRSHVSSLYNFGKDRIEITTSNSSTIIMCLFVAVETFVDSAATVWFPQVYTFQSSYPWSLSLNTQWWFMVTNRISVATCLPVRFLETPTCHNINEFISPFPYGLRCRWWLL